MLALTWLPRAAALRANAMVARRAPRPARRAFVARKAAVAESTYGAQQIVVLEGLEAVRKRPGMYIGSTGSKGLHHLVWEIVDNSVDEVMAGHATRVVVTLTKQGGCVVRDDGRGIPCDAHVSGRSALETVLCVLHAGGKFGGEGTSGYRVSGGLHGVGLSVVNALSSKLEAEVRRNGVTHLMDFSKGKPTTELREEAAIAADGWESGTRIEFVPDTTIFTESTKFDYDTLAARLDELAYLNAGARLELRDERPKAPVNREFFHEGGIAEYADALCAGKAALHPSLGPKTVGRSVEGGTLFTGGRDGVEVECALRWCADQYTDSVVSFANGIRTSDGGSHVEGLKSAVTRVVNAGYKVSKSGSSKTPTASIPGDYIREGLTAVVLVRVPEPEFEGQTKTRLGSPAVRSIVADVVSEALQRHFEVHPRALQAVVDKALAAQSASSAAKAARDLVRRKTLLTSSVLPGKLADCQLGAADAEIFIVEGDSAAGSAKQGRDRATQAILPLRGKILNVEKCAADKIYKNTELQNLISALGLGLRGEEFDGNALRYHRIIIMTDADVDGAHIRSLILTFFYRYQRRLIHEGYVYIACPPLYKAALGPKGSDVYFWTDEELKAAMKAHAATRSAGARPPPVQRFKGLGEMMAEQLWSTTMDPATRRLQRVEVEDASAADRIITLLMGDSVLERKEFISDHAPSIRINELNL